MKPIITVDIETYSPQDIAKSVPTGTPKTQTFRSCCWAMPTRTQTRPECWI